MVGDVAIGESGSCELEDPVEGLVEGSTGPAVVRACLLGGGCGTSSSACVCCPASR